MLTHPLAEYRQKKGLSQRELGEALGVSSVTISRWESWDRFPGPTHLAEIFRLTRATLPQLLGPHQ